MENKLVFAALFLLIGFPSFSHAATLVSPYYRGDTFVSSYYRTDADSNPYNNYGFPGNFNPNTGQTTPGNPDTYLFNYYGIKSSSGDSDLYKLLNSGGLKTVPLPDPSAKLLKEQQDFQNKLEQEKKSADDRLYQLQLQNSTGIFAQCVYPSSLGCSTESQYSSMRATDASSGLLGTDISNNRLSQCRSQIDAYQAAQTKYNQCTSDTQNAAINGVADKAVEAAELEKESAYYKSLLDQATQNQTSCKGSHGEYSYYSSANRCECIDGFAPDAGNPYQCIPLNVWCKVESGVGATNKVAVYVDGLNKDATCGCDVGYQWDTNKVQCAQTVAPDYASLAAQSGGSPAQPKKTLALSDFKIKKPTANSSTSTSSVKTTSLVATSSALDQAPATQTKSSTKQNLFQKLRTFFFGWWR
ncbi:MAG: hypothetical protein WA058_04080 [Minisyncoccia bacterium]